MIEWNDCLIDIKKISFVVKYENKINIFFDNKLNKVIQFNNEKDMKTFINKLK
jgi:hypothetical protein